MLAEHGRVDILVNNAGGQFSAPAEEISLNGWRAVQRLSVEAVWQLTRDVAARSMIPGAGGVVFFNAFSPRRGIPGFAHACAARAALENLAAGLASEWSRHGIRVLALALGSVRTEGLEAYGEDLDEQAKLVPLGRLATPEEVGEITAFLASSGLRLTSRAPRSRSTAASMPGAMRLPRRRASAGRGDPAVQ